MHMQPVLSAGQALSCKQAQPVFVGPLLGHPCCLVEVNELQLLLCLAHLKLGSVPRTMQFT